MYVYVHVYMTAYVYGIYQHNALHDVMPRHTIPSHAMPSRAVP